MNKPYRVPPLSTSDQEEIKKMTEYITLVWMAEQAGVPILEACQHLYQTVYGSEKENQ